MTTLPVGLLTAHPCPQCNQPTLTLRDHATGQPITVDPRFALDGTWHVTNLATATAVNTAPTPGLYRPHTCPPNGTPQ